MTQGYIQIGVTALRDPMTGEPLKSVPMYVKAEDLEETASVPMGIDNLSGVLAEKFREYLEECRAAGLED